MRRIHSDDPEHLEYVGGSLRQSLFGLPFFLAGVWVVFELIRAIAAGTSYSGGGWFTALLVGMAFATAGAWLVVGRRHLRFDRGAKTVSTWWTAIVSFKVSTRAWSEFRDVTVSKENSGRGSSGHTVFAVRLTGGVPLAVATPASVEKARRIGEEVAKFVGVGFADGTGGAVAVREAGKLDESLRDRVRRDGTSLDIGPQPATMRARVERRPGMVTVAFPGEPVDAPSGLVTVAFFAIPAIFVVRVAPDIATALRHQRGLALFLGAFAFAILAPAIAAVGRFVRDLTRRISVEADGTSLRVTTRGLAWARTQTVSVTELEEVRVEHDRRYAWIAAISDRAMLHFGRGLSRDELEWVRGALVHAIAETNPFG